MNWSTLVYRIPDLSRNNFAFNSLIRSVKIRKDSIYGFAKAETGLSRSKLRVGAALKYCSKGCLYATGITGSYSTCTVIHTMAAPPYSMSYLWRFPPQSSLAPKRAWSRSSTTLGRRRYLIWRNVLTVAPTCWPDCQYRSGICRGRSLKISAISLN